MPMGATGAVPSIFPRFNGFFTFVHGRSLLVSDFVPTLEADVASRRPLYRRPPESFNYPEGSHSSPLPLPRLARSLLTIHFLEVCRLDCKAD